MIKAKEGPPWLRWPNPLRRWSRRWPPHAPASTLALALAVALGGFVASFVRVVDWHPLRLESRLVLRPLPSSDWGARWTDALMTAEAQQSAAFQQLGLVILVLSVVGALVALLSFVSLLLGAASAKRGELAARAALGATPYGLGGRLTLHALLLAGPALPAGLVAAWVAAQAAERAWPHSLVSASGAAAWLRPGVTGLLMVAVAVVLSGLLSYLAVVRRPLAAALAGGSRITASPAELQLREALAVVQFAGVLALLSGATILARESRLELEETSVQRASLLVARVDLNGVAYDDRSARVRFLSALRDRVRSLPGVEAETLASAGAWLGVGMSDRVTVECGECFRALMYTPFLSPRVRLYSVMPDFFVVLGVAVEEGRAFAAGDALGAPPVAVVNRSLASSSFERGKPIGRAAQPFGLMTPGHDVVGVVPAIRAPVLGAAGRIDDALYLSALQYPPRALDLLVRVDDHELAAGGLAGLRASMPEGVALHDVQIADQVLRELSSPLRHLAAVLLAITGLVVLLGVHGAFALQRFRVENQQRELSVRLALGATPRALAAHVLAQTARLVRTALLIGAFGALAAARGVQLLLPGAARFAPGVFLLVALLLAVAALLGALLPAARAGRLQPAAVLD